MLPFVELLCLLVGCSNADNKNTEANTQQTETESTTGTLEADTEEETTHTHAYTEAITTEATCEADGVKTFTCECGDSYTEPIKAIGHDYKDDVTAPTCSEKGYTTHTCNTCGNAYTDTEVSATGHAYGKYTYNNDATYEKDGTETATCSTCGKKNTRTKSGTKLVKEEPAECPVQVNTIVDCGDYFYQWRYAHSREDFGQSSAFFAADSYAKSKWSSFWMDGCVDHVEWNGHVICKEVYYNADVYPHK